MSTTKHAISRVTRSKAAAQANYDRLSRWYDIMAGPSEKKYKEAGLQKLAPSKGESILEIGFGTGQCIMTLARMVVPDGKVTGIDLSPKMVERAQRRVDKSGLTLNVDLSHGDAARLPFEDESFDGVFISFTLELFDTPEIPVVLAQCHRVLKPSGRLCVVAMSKPEQPGMMVRLYEWAHRKWPNMVDCRPIHVNEALESAGYIDLDSTKMSMWGMPVQVALVRK